MCVLHNGTEPPSPSSISQEALLDEKLLALVRVRDRVAVVECVDGALDALAGLDLSVGTITLPVLSDGASLGDQLVVRPHHGADGRDEMGRPQLRHFLGSQVGVDVARHDAVHGNVVAGEEWLAHAPCEADHRVLGRVVRWSEGKWVDARTGSGDDHFRVVWSQGRIRSGFQCHVRFAGIMHEQPQTVEDGGLVDFDGEKIRFRRLAVEFPTLREVTLRDVVLFRRASVGGEEVEATSRPVVRLLE